MVLSHQDDGQPRKEWSQGSDHLVSVDRVVDDVPLYNHDSERHALLFDHGTL